MGRPSQYFGNFKTRLWPERSFSILRRDQDGNAIWPAPKSQIEKAKDFLRECAAARKRTLIVPDKDADGLAAGAIIRKTLILLGLHPKLISCYTMTKNSLLHYADSRANMEAYNPSYIIVLDQGSWKSEPVIDSPHRAAKLINAPRRTADYDVPRAWQVLIKASSPIDLVKNKFLKEARTKVIHEMKRADRLVPLFSADKKIAVIRIKSKAQIHALIAERQARQLSSRELQVVMVANEGYARGVVNYSCRVPTCARGRDPPVDIPEILSRAADGADDDTLRERLGPRFAVGHKNASGGMIPQTAFEDFLQAIGASSDKKPSPSPRKSG
ncbi:single-stranded-DNA-specific exonuclease [Fusarium tjaetaba]|uniref:Single-stranded-DNA-specific exonuclease n=1 Tax=Fusarium tjaetaba TaxID=1567544 RepID=A0A8H5REB6_9HYPO|nr:single-stranded-DNA-specific exonuclease [Fusarium tjaetaba]KAF5630997.1 single-stranded-DNA-specific exonuclease [Fusarium tjaetaba]